MAVKIFDAIIGNFVLIAKNPIEFMGTFDQKFRIVHFSRLITFKLNYFVMTQNLVFHLNIINFRHNVRQYLMQVKKTMTTCQ